MTTKQDLINAKKEKRLHVYSGFYKDFPTWSDINDLYSETKSGGLLDYNSFGTMLIEDTEHVLKYYNDAVKDISLIHTGRIHFAMMIIHFINRNNNTISDESCKVLIDRFYQDNPKKIPQELTIKDDGVDGWPRESWDPAVHSDPEDRFFIQNDGQSLWKVFHDNEELNYEVVLSAGDTAYIPKGVIHSVESLCPRHAVSIALSDDPEIK